MESSAFVRGLFASQEIRYKIHEHNQPIRPIIILFINNPPKKITKRLSTLFVSVELKSNHVQSCLSGGERNVAAQHISPYNKGIVGTFFQFHFQCLSQLRNKGQLNARLLQLTKSRNPQDDYCSIE